MLRIKFRSIFREVAPMLMLQIFFDDQSTYIQIILGAVKQQAITFANVDPYLCRHSRPQCVNLTFNIVQIFHMYISNLI